MSPGQLSISCASFRHGQQCRQFSKLKGVLLRAIVGKDAVILRNDNDSKQMSVLATASDGYTVVFLRSGIFNSPVGDGVLVFFEKSGVAERRRGPDCQHIDPGYLHRRAPWKRLQSLEMRKIVD